MAKVFAILLVVLGVWVGLEWMSEGGENAFGGLFVKAGLITPSETPTKPATQRASHAVDRAYRAGESRVDRQMGQTSE